MRLRQLLPPFLYESVNRWKRSRIPVFASYDEAFAQSGEGYADTDLPAVVREKTERFINSSPRAGMEDVYVANTLLAVATAAALSPTRPLRVLDFGGAFGTAYHLVNEILPLPCRWAVVESPSFAAAGRVLETDNLRFFGSIEAATAWLGEVDLVHSSSTIQYVSDPEAVILALLATRPACVAWLRTTFSAGDRFVELQTSQLKGHGPGELPPGVRDRTILVPRTYLPLDWFQDAMAKDYDLVARLGDTGRHSSVAGIPVILDDRFIYTRRSDA